MTPQEPDGKIQPLQHVQPSVISSAVAKVQVQMQTQTGEVVTLDRMVLQIECDVGSFHFFIGMEHARAHGKAVTEIARTMKKDPMEEPPSAIQTFADIPDEIKRRNHN